MNEEWYCKWDISIYNLFLPRIRVKLMFIRLPRQYNSRRLNRIYEVSDESA